MRLKQIELEGKTVQIACAHWKTFPPLAAALGKSSAELWAQHLVTEADYQRYKIWEQICGLFLMDETKCLHCPHVRLAQMKQYLPVLVSLDGKIVTPTLDLPSLESSSRHRKFLDSINKSMGGKK